MNEFSLVGMAKDLLSIEEDYRFRLKNKSTRISDFALYDFNSIWGSTSLGFGGIGGQAMTTARTYVLVPNCDNEDCLIYFSGRFAYSVPYSTVLMDDILAHKIESVSNKSRYL